MRKKNTTDTRFNIFNARCSKQGNSFILSPLHLLIRRPLISLIHSFLPSFIHFGSVHFIPFVHSPTCSSVRSCIIHSIFGWFTHCSLMHLIRRIFESNETMDRGTFATGRVVQHTTWYSTAETNVRHGHSTVGPWFVTKNCNLNSVLCKMYPVHCQQNQGLLAKTALYFISSFVWGAVWEILNPSQWIGKMMMMMMIIRSGFRKTACYCRVTAAGHIQTYRKYMWVPSLCEPPVCIVFTLGRVVSLAIRACVVFHGAHQITTFYCVQRTNDKNT